MLVSYGGITVYTAIYLARSGNFPAGLSKIDFKIFVVK